MVPNGMVFELFWSDIGYSFRVKSEKGYGFYIPRSEKGYQKIKYFGPK